MLVVECFDRSTDLEKETTMSQKKGTLLSRIRTLPFLFLIVLSAGCAGTNAQSLGQRGYVEIDNPAFTMSPTAPEKIWVPRESVDKGVPRGGELVKRGYESVTGSEASAPQPTTTPVSTVAPAQAGITEPAGKPARLVPHFGLVVALDGNKVYFNLGREAGYSPGQILKIHRGGTVIEGLGLAPGELIGTVEVLGYVGTRGGYGLLKQGGPVRLNDLIGIE
jgi:hypothetical protein